jgi:hypothetical protein
MMRGWGHINILQCILSLVLLVLQSVMCLFCSTEPNGAPKSLHAPGARPPFFGGLSCPTVMVGVRDLGVHGFELSKTWFTHRR